MPQVRPLCGRLPQQLQAELVCLTKRHLMGAVKCPGELLAAWQCMAAVFPDLQLELLHHTAAAGFPEASRRHNVLQGVAASMGTASCSFDFCCSWLPHLLQTHQCLSGKQPPGCVRLYNWSVAYSWGCRHQ